MLPFIVAGLTSGSVFALAAVGLVLTYKTSGIFNFAHGALASAAAFVFYFLQQQDVAWPIAALISIVLVTAVLGPMLELIARRVTSAPLTYKVLSTVGVVLVLQGGLDLIYPPGTDRQVVQYLPDSTFQVFGTTIAWYRVIIFAIGVVCVGALTLFLRRSRNGMAMRAVVEDPELLDIAGTSPVRVRRLAWLIGTATAATSGVLIAPLVPLDATTLTFLVVTAFGAAAVGGFTSLPLTYLGALAIGIGQAVLQEFFINSIGLTSGLAEGLPFLVLFLLLIVAPRLKRPSTERIRHEDLVTGWRAPLRVQIVGGLVLLAFLIAVPAFAGLHTTDWTRFLAFTMVFLSLGLLVRMSGQVSLAQVSFMAIGAAAFSHLAVNDHWPWLAAVLVAGLIAAPVGAVLAIPAIRFPGLYLALATFGFGLLLQQMFYSQGYMFGPLSLGLNMPTPYLSWVDVSSDNGFYYVVLIFVVVASLLVVVISGSRLGRLVGAMASSPQGLRACGTSINVSRVIVFCIAATMAAVAGSLDGVAQGIVGSDGYAPFTSLQLLAVVLLTVGGAPWYAFLGAACQILIPAYISTNANVTYMLTVFFGVNAVLLAITPASRRQLPVRVRQFVDRLGGGGSSATQVELPGLGAVPAALRTRVNSGLTIDAVTVRYGGHLAADNVSLRAKVGSITGLIGPNGAGKTTIFNACSGVLHPASGTIRLDDKTLNRMSLPGRARRGIGRTFQQMELFDTMSVRGNVSLGCEGPFAGWNPVDHLFASKKQRTLVQARTAEAIELCGIADIADQPVGQLSTGRRRLVELARCLAGPFQMLLLDEPSSGLDRIETARFGEILLRVVADRHLGILLIEHDMALINHVCDYVYVLDFGQQIFDGSPTDVGASPAVRAAYLGEVDTLGGVTVENEAMDA